MATIIPFTSSQPEQPHFTLSPRTYNLEISAYANDYLEFRADGVKTDPKSLYQIAAELEKIASIIRSDVITDAV